MYEVLGLVGFAGLSGVRVWAVPLHVAFLCLVSALNRHMA